MKHFRSKTISAITGVFLGTFVFAAQPSTSLGEQGPQPEWVDTSNREHVAMIFALNIAERVISGEYGLVIDSADQQILDTIPARLQGVKENIRGRIAVDCANYAQGLGPRVSGAAAIVQKYEEVNYLVSSAYEELYFELMNELSVEIGFVLGNL